DAVVGFVETEQFEKVVVWVGENPVDDLVGAAPIEIDCCGLARDALAHEPVVELFRARRLLAQPLAQRIDETRHGRASVGPEPDAERAAVDVGIVEQLTPEVAVLRPVEPDAIAIVGIGAEDQHSKGGADENVLPRSTSLDDEHKDKDEHEQKVAGWPA